MRTRWTARKSGLHSWFYHWLGLILLNVDIPVPSSAGCESSTVPNAMLILPDVKSITIFDKITSSPRPK